MKNNILLLIVAFIFLFPKNSVGQVNEQDSLALVDLYNSLDGSNWTYKANWLSNTELNYWSGIRIENNRVIDINLVFNGLSGTLPLSIGNLTALKELKLNGNITGKIPAEIGNLKALTRLSISGKLTGSIPKEIGNLTYLTDIYLGGNSLTENIPPEIGNLTNLVFCDFRDNNLTGIPPEIGNLKALTSLNISRNNIAGSLPSEIGNLTSLDYLDLAYNNLTGSIPPEIGNLASLTKLNLQNNNISGSIPPQIGQLSNLTDLSLMENNLSGTIPAEMGNLVGLKYLILYENHFSGNLPSEIGKLSNLFRLNLSNNNISGTIPKELGNLSVLYSLSLNNNNLSGIIPKEIGKLTALTELYLSKNNLLGNIPSELTNLKSLKRFNLDNNKFVFSDLEILVPMNIPYFYYGWQDTVNLEKTSSTGSIELNMNVGGTQTTYQWYYQRSQIAGATSKSITIPSDKDALQYHCEAKNSLLPQLTLIGEYDGDGKSCWKTGQLEFCVSNGKWVKAGGDNRIGATDIISVNDYLFFDGNMTIDTILLQVDASGEFYVKDLPFKGGSIEKYTLAKGSYNLKLLGDNGQITNFLNSSLSDSAVLFGCKLKIDNLQLVSKKDTTGLKIGCTISIPGISGTCGGLKEVDSDVKLTDLEITTAGITLGGIAVKDLGIRDGYCLKELDVSYDSKKDIFKAITKVELPFGKIDGGLKLEEGLMDSIGWRLEAEVSPFVLGATTIGIKGFFGHISSITYPKMEIELGGIFSDIFSNDLYLIEASGKTIWPSYFEVKGSGKFLRPIIDEIPFQLQGGVRMGYNIPNKYLELEVNGNFGTLDEKNWFISGAGLMKINHRDPKTKFHGNFKGQMSVSDKIFKENLPMPLSYMSSILGLPFSAKTDNIFISAKEQYISGNATLNSAFLGSFKIDYLIDISKPIGHQDYFYWYSVQRGNNKSAIVRNKSGNISSISNSTFEVPANTEYTIFNINSQSTPPSTKLVSPDGQEFNTSSSENKVLYSVSHDKTEAFWTVLNPKPGMWDVISESPATTDTIFHYSIPVKNEFKFSVNQTGNSVHVSWDISQVEEGQTISIMLDNDNADFDGFSIAEGDAALGSLNFILDESTPDCNYYLFVELIDDFRVVQTYADKAIENPLASLAPPENLSSQYNTETGEFDFAWTPSSSSEITGYILTITDELGNDSVYAILNGYQTKISLFIEDFETKSAKIESFNHDWKIGCPTTAIALTTSLDDFYQMEKPENKLHVFPNPTTGNLTIRYYVSDDSKCEIRIFDIKGRQIAQPLAEYKTAGFHQLNFNYEHVPNGLYIIKFMNDYQTFTGKSILSK